MTTLAQLGPGEPTTLEAYNKLYVPSTLDPATSILLGQSHLPQSALTPTRSADGVYLPAAANIAITEMAGSPFSPLTRAIHTPPIKGLLTQGGLNPLTGKPMSSLTPRGYADPMSGLLTGKDENGNPVHYYRNYRTGEAVLAPNISNFGPVRLWTLPKNNYQAQSLDKANAWWGQMIQKYGLPPAATIDTPNGNENKDGNSIMVPAQQAASDEDLKQYFRYDVTLKSSLGWSPFLVDSADYGDGGLGWLDTSETNGSTGTILPHDHDYRQAALSKIDSLSHEDLQAARPKLTDGFYSRFNGWVDYKTRVPIITQIGMGLWTAGAGYIATAGAGSVLAPIADIAGGSSSIAGTILGSDAAAGAAGGAATSAITGGDPLTGALAGGASGAVADFGGNKLSQAVTGQVVGSELTPAPQVPDTADTPTPTQAPSNPYAGLYQSTPTLTAPKAPLQSQGIAPSAAAQPTTVNDITLNAPKAPSLIGAAKAPNQSATASTHTSMAGMILSAPKVPTVKSGLIGQVAG